MPVQFYPESYLNLNADRQRASDERRMANRVFEQQQRQQAIDEQRSGQLFNQNILDKQREREVQDTQRRNEEAGAGAFADYFKNMAEPQAGQPGPAVQGPMPNGQTVQGASIGPNVTPTQALPKPQMQPMTFDTVAASLIKNPRLANDPMAFAAALDRFKPIFDVGDKQKAEMFTKQLEVQNRPAQTAQGKRAQDVAAGLIKPGDDGLLKITELPDAQSRKQAMTEQAAIASAAAMMDNFDHAKTLINDSFEAGVVPVGMRMMAIRAAGKNAPESERKSLVATQEYQRLIQRQILPQLRQAFGGRVTNFETQFLNDIEGTKEMSKAERIALVEQAQEAIQQREMQARESLASLGVRVTESDYKSKYAAKKADTAQTQPQTIDFNSWK